MQSDDKKGNVVGKVVGVLLIASLIGLGVFLIKRHKPDATPQADPNASQVVVAPGVTLPDDKELVETLPTAKKLDAPNAYVPTDNTLVVELSEYGGYSGLIAYNGGLAPSENSGFFKDYGFKVKLTVSEEESWSKLNSGKMAASATTTDVLAVYGRQFKVVVPALIGFSRGADALVVTSGISKVNDLRGKVVASCQFTESDFLIRYLAQDAGVAVNMLPDLKTKPDPDAVNLVYCDTGLSAGDLLLKDVQSGANRLAGCTSWSPKTEEIVSASGGKLKPLVSNRNLLIVSDILVVNKGFADANPKMVAGLTGGLLRGNKMVRESPAAYYDLIEKAFKWEKGKAKGELGKVHLANLPENIAYFSGEIDSAGSFDGIFQSSVLAYGPAVITDPVSPATFVNTTALKEIEKSGVYAGDKVAIAPIKLGGASLEHNPILSKNVRFLFQPNSAALEPNDANNLKNVEAIREMLKVSPGGSITLRGHVDDGQKGAFAASGEESLRKGALRAMKLSLDRANGVRDVLVKSGIPAERIDTIGRGWEEPLGADKDQNRRVEVQWFTVE
jgi:NitT/TauT family transport system substrate-binding protein